MSEVQVIGCWAPLVYDYDSVSWWIKSQGLRIEEECPFIWGAEFSSVQFSCSVVSDSLRPHESQHTRLPVHHQLLEFTQTHVHWVSDAIQPSHPLSSPSPPAPNPSQHQSLFQWVNSSHEVAEVLDEWGPGDWLLSPSGLWLWPSLMVDQITRP